MYFSDYHAHTSFSPDSKALMEDICACAVEKGMQEICFTDHLECGPLSSFWQNNIRPYAVGPIREELRRLRPLFDGKLLLKHGVEMGQWMQEMERANAAVAEGAYDFVLASVHSPANFPDMSQLDYGASDSYKALEAYCNEILDMARTCEFDTLGHLTLPVRYAKRRQIELTMKEYTPVFQEIFRVLVERGRGIEVNTSGFRGDLQQALPDKWLLQLYKECGGEIVTIGSDSHRAQDIGEGIREGQALLREVGFRYFATYTTRKLEMKIL